MYCGEINHKGTSHPGLHDAIVEQELWDQVQAQFAENRQFPRRRPRSSSKSLLTGLLYDPHGNRFTPSHAAKGAKRYRYYVSQTLIKKTDGIDGPMRLPAPELEELVISQIQSERSCPQL